MAAELLSAHVFLEEALRTSHREIDNSIEQTLRYGRIHSVAQINKDMERTARTLLDPLIEKFGKGFISSGYRCRELNHAVGGAANSAHTVGLAFDWIPPAATSIAAAMVWAFAQPPEAMPFDRLIVEQRGKSKWLHIQAPPDGSEEILRLAYDSPRAGLFVRMTHDRMLELDA